MTTESNNYATVLRSILSWMVRYAADIEVSQNGDKPVRLTARVNRADHGMVIGAAGRNVNRISNIMHTMAERRGDSLVLDVLEPRVGTHERFPTPSMEGWDRDHDVRVFLEMLLSNLVGCSVQTEMMTNPRTTALVASVALQPEIEADVTALFHAIGKANGRNLVVSYAEPMDSTPGGISAR